MEYNLPYNSLDESKRKIKFYLYMDVMFYFYVNSAKGTIDDIIRARLM